MPTPNDPGLLVPGNIFDQLNRKQTKPPAGPNGLQQGTVTSLSGKKYGSPKGEISTEYTKSFDISGKQVLLPTVVNGRFYTDEEAIDWHKKTGQHFGIFDTWQNAEAFANKMHNQHVSAMEFSRNLVGDTKKK